MGFDRSSASRRPHLRGDDATPYTKRIQHRRQPELGRNAGVRITGHRARTIAIAVACRRNLARHANIHARIADLRVRTCAGRITGEETHAGHARLAIGAISIHRALEVRI